jgi:hypothetical protein
MNRGMHPHLEAGPVVQPLVAAHPSAQKLTQQQLLRKVAHLQLRIWMGITR